MKWIAKLFGKKKTAPPNASQTAAPTQKESVYLTQTVVFGMHQYRSAGEDSAVFFVDETRGIRKMLVDHRGRIQNFPGIVNKDALTKIVSADALTPQIRFRTSFKKREDRWIMLWEVQPDGRYWEDEDGFGGTNDEEVTLCTYVDRNGNFTGPFEIYQIGEKSITGYPRCAIPSARQRSCQRDSMDFSKNGRPSWRIFWNQTRSPGMPNPFLRHSFTGVSTIS